MIEKGAQVSGGAAASGGSTTKRRPNRKKSPSARAQSPGTTSSGERSPQSPAQRLKMINDRKKVTLFQAPMTTLKHFAMICWEGYRTVFEWFSSRKLLSFSIISAGLVFFVLHSIEGPHTFIIDFIKSNIAFAFWWTILGVLSSIGLGTGLHTFVLYLGPFIAKVTLAISECGTSEIDTSGPRAFICPDISTSEYPPTFWDVYFKVNMAAFLWGLGTALGELPPYFVARAARNSGKKLEELEIDVNAPTSPGKKESKFMKNVKAAMLHFLENHGFLAIVLCASIPNPLFDLAGITCGHFGIPFWRFFGATFIGKSLIKANIQSAFVILMFESNHMDVVIQFVESRIPSLKGKIKPFFDQQRAQFHKNDDDDPAGKPLLTRAWEIIVVVMIFWFLKSIIETLVQERIAEIDAKKLKAEHSETDNSSD